MIEAAAMKRRNADWPVSAMLAAAMLFNCHDVRAAAAGVSADVEELEEVEVLGRKLWQMRQDILVVEERFYSMYNELNTDDDFDIRCERVARTGTLIKQRVCKPVFHARAQEEEGRAFAEGRAAPPASLVLLQRNAEYRNVTRDLVTKNPHLLELLKERAELQQKYDRARKERFKDRWILFE
jgi:hypothetical protein